MPHSLNLVKPGRRKNQYKYPVSVDMSVGVVRGSPAHVTSSLVISDKYS